MTKVRTVAARATPRADQLATYNEALRMLAGNADLEPTSAFKAAAHAAGIPFGEEMGRFVTWARARYLGEP